MNYLRMALQLDPPRVRERAWLKLGVLTQFCVISITLIGDIGHPSRNLFRNLNVGRGPGGGSGGVRRE